MCRACNWKKIFQISSFYAMKHNNLGYTITLHLRASAMLRYLLTQSVCPSIKRQYYR